MEQGELHVHDIVIVGAGPCGLAVAARLRETTPSALFTDSEHQRYHWMRSSSSSRKVSKLIRTSRRSNTAPDRLISGPTLDSTSRPDGPDMIALDAFGDSWMGAWDKKFKDLKISHLRSPMFFHPDPRDRDGMLEYAYKDGPPHPRELREIKGVVGKSLSKHQRKQKIKNSGKSQHQETTYLDERERHDYFRPSQRLFSSYYDSIIKRYDLSSLVQKSEVLSISYCSSACRFTLQTTTGIKYARIVVLATGATAKPALPPSNPFSVNPTGGVCHAFSPTGVITPGLQSKIQAGRDTCVAVIGGGLTSAQISSLAVASGVTQVHQFIRGPLKTKHFDVDLSWVGKYKNFHLASFWSADSDEERFEMIRDARGGGSVNPEYKGVLCDLIKKGKAILHEFTEINGATWSEESQTWTVQTSSPTTIELPEFDHVIYATGVSTNMETVPMMQPVIAERPVKMIGGMPALTHDLMWDEQCPLFVTGRLAGLRLGPGAGNLEGARQGAERVAWKVGELLAKWEGAQNTMAGMLHEEHLDAEPATEQEGKASRKARADSGYGSYEGSDGEVDMRRLGLGVLNQFGVLAMDDQFDDSD